MIWGLYCVQSEVYCHMTCTAVQFGRYVFYRKYRGSTFPQNTGKYFPRYTLWYPKRKCFTCLTHLCIRIILQVNRRTNWNWKPLILRWGSLCNAVFLGYLYVFSVSKFMRRVRIVAKTASYLHHIRLSFRRSAHISMAPTGPISVKFDIGDFH